MWRIQLSENYMKQNTKNGAAPAVVERTSVFTFKTRPVIAPKGLQQAVWRGAVRESWVDKSQVVVSVEIKNEQAPGAPPFTLQKRYNIGKSGRGNKMFIDDYNAWAGAGFVEDDLYDQFDGHTDDGKLLLVHVGHRKVGKDWEAVIESFHPLEVKDKEVTQ